MKINTPKTKNTPNYLVLQNKQPDLLATAQLQSFTFSNIPGFKLGDVLLLSGEGYRTWRSAFTFKR